MIEDEFDQRYQEAYLDEYRQKEARDMYEKNVGSAVRNRQNQEMEEEQAPINDETTANTNQRSKFF